MTEKVDMGSSIRVGAPVGLPSNSKEPPKKKVLKDAAEKKVEKVIEGTVIQKKKTLTHRIVETFAGDTIENVGTYVLFDVVIPATKNLVQDIVVEGVAKLLFGDGRSARVNNIRGANYTAYQRYSNGGTVIRASTPAAPTISNQARSNHDFGTIIFSSRDEAILVLDNLTELIDTYQVATVSDFYNLVGITPSYMDGKYGWNNLRDAACNRVSGGYVLSLPRPLPVE